MLTFINSTIPFSKIESFTNLIQDYLSNEPFLRKFYEFENSIEGVNAHLEGYSNSRLDRQLLKSILHLQYKNSGSQVHENTRKNIESLSLQNSYTITTGHQLNILGGPLYVFYKALSVINMAESLSKQLPAYNFVPVFWMAAEDHDIEEISSINLFGKKYIWKPEWDGVAGKMPLNGIESFIDEVISVFGKSEFGEELVQIIKSSYLSSQNLADANRKFLNAFFGKYGLVILDGNDSALKKRIKDIIDDELRNHTSATLINKTNVELESKYYSQAQPRDINLFYIHENFRERLVEEGESIAVLNKNISFSKESLQNELDTYTERFSPNVLLRPVYQESILPNICFVGGPAEVAYWLELKNVFNYFKVPMPVIFLRSCAAILEKGILEKLEKFSISDDDLFLTSDEWIKKFLKNKSESFSINDVQNSITSQLDELGKNVTIIDPSLFTFIEAEKQKLKSVFSTLQEKIIRLQKKKNENEVNQLQKLKEKLFPNGNLQEREDSIIPYFLKYGHHFIEELKKNLDPFSKEFNLLKERY